MGEEYLRIMRFLILLLFLLSAHNSFSQKIDNMVSFYDFGDENYFRINY